MPASSNMNDLVFRPSPRDPSQQEWVAPDGRVFDGPGPLLRGLAERVLRGEKILISSTTHGVAAARRRRPDLGYAWMNNAQHYRMVRWLHAPDQDELILASDIQGWANRGSLQAHSPEGEFLGNFSISWGPQ